MAKQKITEEMGVHKAWAKEAEDVRTPDDLLKFMERLGEDFEHDYGTICHAMSAFLLAAGKAFDRTYGGITGFQASFVMWGFIRDWMLFKGPLRLVQFQWMLYPQYAGNFDRTISPDTWAWPQKEARERLHEGLHPEVKAHMESILAGKVPFGYEVHED